MELNSPYILQLKEFSNHPVSASMSTFSEGMRIYQDGAPALHSERRGNFRLFRDEGRIVEARLASLLGPKIEVDGKIHYFSFLLDIPGFEKTIVTGRRKEVLQNGEVTRQDSGKFKLVADNGETKLARLIYRGNRGYYLQFDGDRRLYPYRAKFTGSGITLLAFVVIFFGSALIPSIILRNADGCLFSHSLSTGLSC